MVALFLQPTFLPRSFGRRLQLDMDETLRQLGGLLLGSIPTIILFLVVFVAYRALVHKPLARVLGERHERTTGAVERARADIGAVEAKTALYEQRLREARVAVFKAQEQRRQQALNARSVQLSEARARAQQQVQAARAALQNDKASAQNGLRSEAERLASEIINAVLRPAAAAETPVAGGRP
jgi:F-type H+-transporting ATPase subunit b